MTVKELKKLLGKFPENFEVILAKDEDGQCGFSPLNEIQIGAYAEQHSYLGIFEETGKGEQNAICLWPVR